MKLKVRNYQCFPELKGLGFKQLNQEGWGILRAKNPQFAFPRTVAEYKQHLDRQNNVLAEYVAEGLQKRGITSAVSFGCGTGAFEFLLKQDLPCLHLLCSEYIEEQVKLIKHFVPCEEVQKIDLLCDELPSSQQYQIGILKRVDNGFSDAQMSFLFRKFAETGYERILFMATSLLTFHLLRQRVRQYLYQSIRRFLGRNNSGDEIFTGYSRTASLLNSFWSKYYVFEEEQSVEGHWVVWLKRGDIGGN